MRTEIFIKLCVNNKKWGVEKLMVFVKKHSEISKMKKSLKESFFTIRKEFEDHLLAINENTLELSTHTEILNELDNKLEKLNEKLDSVILSMSQKEKEIVLTQSEQKIFLLLYMSKDEHFIPIFEMVEKTNIPEMQIRSSIAHMQKAGLPIYVKTLNLVSHYMLDSEFKLKQAKENIIKIDEMLIKTINEKSLTSFF